MLLEQNLQRPTYDVEHRRPIRIKTRNPQGMNGWFDKQIKSIKRDLSIKNVVKAAPLVVSASQMIPQGTITKGINFLENSKVGQAVKYLENSQANVFLRDLSKTKVGSAVTNFVKEKGTPVATDFVKSVLTPSQKETIDQVQKQAETNAPNNAGGASSDPTGTTGTGATGTTTDTTAKDKDNTMLYVAGGIGVLGLAYLAFK